MRNYLAFIALFLTAHFYAQPRNVIIYIGDGYGMSAKAATRLAMGQGQTGARYSTDHGFQVLNADRLKYQGTLTTHSMNSWITDSAPGSTVYACGQKGKVHNEAIAFNMDAMMPVETILEYAKKQGYAVGVVTTTRVTHATPADFTTHTWSRDLENELAAQMISSTQTQYMECYGAAYDSSKHWVLPSPKIGVEIDVILGGGASRFLPKAVSSANAVVNEKIKFKGNRTADIDLIALAQKRGFEYVNQRDALLNLDYSKFKPGGQAKLLGLFNSSHMAYENDRQTEFAHEPTLALMTEVAIEVLKRKGGEKGFFLMVEGGRIDHLEHANSGGIVAKDGKFHIGCDHEVASPDEIYTGINDSVSGNYGSDYLIKEVLAFDHAIGEGRKLLQDTTRKTLLFSTSDHECGGLAVVALHDEADEQKNGTKVRTYASEPKQAAAFGDGTHINPNGVSPGKSWFPDYEKYDFQGYKWPRPRTKTSPRIVISYGSNPVVNGNGTSYLSGYNAPGNHTPQDVWVGADDNQKGAWASRITGRGQLDNTDITPIMRDFLGLDGYSCWDPALEYKHTIQEGEYQKYKLFIQTKDKSTDSKKVMVRLTKPKNAKVFYPKEGLIETENTLEFLAPLGIYPTNIFFQSAQKLSINDFKVEVLTPHTELKLNEKFETFGHIISAPIPLRVEQKKKYFLVKYGTILFLDKNQKVISTHSVSIGAEKAAKITIPKGAKTAYASNGYFDYFYDLK
jgi:alkaline phosphatase